MGGVETNRTVMPVQQGHAGICPEHMEEQKTTFRDRQIYLERDVSGCLCVCVC